MRTSTKTWIGRAMVLTVVLAAGSARADSLFDILFGRGRTDKPDRHPAPPAGRVTLASGQAVTRLAGRVGGRHYFELHVQPGTERLTLQTQGGAGDSDLYLSHGSLPDPKSYQYVSNGGTTAESIAVARPKPGVWYALVYGYGRFADVSLVARWAGAGRPHGRPGIRIQSPVAGQALTAGRPVAIQWTASGRTQRVAVMYSLDDGRTWTRISPAGGVPAAAGRLVWTAPLLAGRRPTATVHLKVADAERPLISATTDRLEIRRLGGHPGHPGPGGPRPGHVADPFEPNDQSSRARRIEANTAQRHRIVREGDEDWLMFVPPAVGAYRVLFSDATTELKVGLYSARKGGKKEYYARSFKVGRGGYTVDLTAGPNALYFKLHVEARDDDDTGSYRVTVQQVVPAAPPRPGPPARGRQPRN